VAACAFCEIVGGTAPSDLVLDDGVTLAFLDRRPVFPGHTILIPRLHVESLAELSDDLAVPLLGAARRIAAALEKGLGAEGAFLGINNRVSQSVPHLHIHLVPRSRGDGLRGFFWPRQNYRDDQHRQETLEALRAALASPPS
jgi:histidine triad (HIT) family protein